MNQLSKSKGNLYLCFLFCKQSCCPLGLFSLYMLLGVKQWAADGLSEVREWDDL